MGFQVLFPKSKIKNPCLKTKFSNINKKKIINQERSDLIDKGNLTTSLLLKSTLELSSKDTQPLIKLSQRQLYKIL